MSQGKEIETMASPLNAKAARLSQQAATMALREGEEHRAVWRLAQALTELSAADTGDLDDWHTASALLTEQVLSRLGLRRK